MDVAVTEPITWTDWRGNTYAVGSLVLYPRLSGRSCHMCEGTVTEMWETYRGDSYKWVRLVPSELPPFVKRYAWFRVGSDAQIEPGRVQDIPRDAREYREYETDEREKTERRIKIMPTGRSSRFEAYHNQKWDREQQALVDTEQKPVTLSANVESVTAVVP